MDSFKFGKKYFVGGAESNYIDYRKKKYKQLCKDIIKITKATPLTYFLDYGCGTGILCMEINKFCYCIGTDISDWAISYVKNHDNKKYKMYEYYNKELLSDYKFDFILFLDVLEHCSKNEINDILRRIRNHSQIIVRIPVCVCKNDNHYYLECSNKDKTHVQCHTKTWWRKLFKKYKLEIIKVIDEKRVYDSDGVIAWILKKEE